MTALIDLQGIDLAACTNSDESAVQHVSYLHPSFIIQTLLSEAYA